MRTIIFRALLASAAILGGVSSAHAIPTLRLTTSAGGDITVSDDGVGDSWPGPGVVLFNGSLPGWNVNITSGLSKPAVGSAESPLLDLGSVNLNSIGTAGSIDIWLTDTDFAAIPSAAGVLAAIGGTTSGTITYKTYFDSSNAPFGTGTELTSMGPFSSTAFSNSAYGTLTSAGPFSLTLFVSIFHDGTSPFQLTSFDATVKVPEPSTLLLVGLGLVVALALAPRRRLATAPFAR